MIATESQTSLTDPISDAARATVELPSLGIPTSTGFTSTTPKRSVTVFLLHSVPETVPGSRNRISDISQAPISITRLTVCRERSRSTSSSQTLPSTRIHAGSITSWIPLEQVQAVSEPPEHRPPPGVIQDPPSPHRHRSFAGAINGFGRDIRVWSGPHAAHWSGVSWDLCS